MKNESSLRYNLISITVLLNMKLYYEHKIIGSFRSLDSHSVIVKNFVENLDVSPKGFLRKFERVR